VHMSSQDLTKRLQDLRTSAELTRARPATMTNASTQRLFLIYVIALPASFGWRGGGMARRPLEEPGS
jgi:hypothetical protein